MFEVPLVARLEALRISAVAILVVTTLGIAMPSSAGAVVCGEATATGEVRKGFLALNENTARPEKHFKRSTGHGTLSLIFRVSGCDLPTDAPPPTMTPLPPPVGEELDKDKDAITFESATLDPHSLEVLLDVDAQKLDPGSYGALIALRAPYIATTRTPVTVSRSENRVWIPLLLGAVSAFAGLLIFSVLKFLGRITLNVRPWWLIFAAAVACAAGAGVVYANYADQEVWTFGDNWQAAFGTGFSAGTSGVMTALLAAMWRTDTRAG
jgi:hypothetical protein